MASEDFGLTEDEILLLDDRALNKLVSLKKYRPYIDVNGPVNEDASHREVSAGLKRKHQEITDKERRKEAGEEEQDPVEA